MQTVERSADRTTPMLIRDTTDVPVDALLELYRHASWAQERTAEGVAESLAGTYLLLTGWYGSRCVAMLRVISDGTYRAFIDDVIVHPEFQGRGWGRQIVEAALAHPRVRHVEHVNLFTQIPAFYEKFGFRPNPLAMRLDTPPEPNDQRRGSATG
jgi:GNAT superfamily N-acetyltransferase